MYPLASNGLSVFVNDDSARLRDGTSTNKDAPNLQIDTHTFLKQILCQFLLCVFWELPTRSHFSCSLDVVN